MSVPASAFLTGPPFIFDQQRTSYSYERLNRLTRADQVTYSYDVHGNVTEKVDADGRVQYTYDSRQQLTRVDFPDGTSVSYAYDAFGRRVMRDETYWHNNGRLRSDVVHYLYDGLEVLKEYGGTPGEGRPPLAEYWRANGRIVARRLYGNPTRPGPGNDDFLFTRGGLLYYHYDALGTVQALTDRHGDVLAQYYYDVFGQPWAGPLGAYNAYALTGKEYDAKTGLYYFGARWYDPQVGRWMSQDPARDGLNWYTYVGNSPTAYVDFWGLWRKKELGDGGHAFVAEEGDTLGLLALGLYGDASMAAELAAHNGISDPNMIQAGQAIEPLPVYGPPLPASPVQDVTAEPERGTKGVTITLSAKAGISGMVEGGIHWDRDGNVAIVIIAGGGGSGGAPGASGTVNYAWSNAANVQELAGIAGCVGGGAGAGLVGGATGCAGTDSEGNQVLSGSVGAGLGTPGWSAHGSAVKAWVFELGTTNQ